MVHETQEDPIEARFLSLEQRLGAIEDRNASVQADKAWETSRFRVLSVCLLTYIVAACLMFAIGARNPFVDALVPVVGFYLSTQSLPAIKRYWIDRRKRSIDETVESSLR